MIKVWGRPSSANVQKVLWALHECGLFYENEVVGGPYGGTNRTDFSALTPVRKIPVLEDDDVILWESHAILRYLAASRGGVIAPPERAWAIADQWMEYTTSTLQPPFIGLFWQVVRTPEAERSAALTDQHRANFYSALGPLEQRLSEVDWLAGLAFSIADIAAGSLFYRATEIAEPFEGRPRLAQWYERLKARPAYQDVVMTPYDELRA